MKLARLDSERATPTGGQFGEARSNAGAFLNIAGIADAAANGMARLAAIQRVPPDSLDDAESEKTSVAATQKAVLNILDDFAEEKVALANVQRAVLNILDDAESEKTSVAATQKAVLNILDDATEEKGRLADVQRAVLNILEDFEVEKNRTDLANIALRDEVAARTLTEEKLRRAKVGLETSNSELESFSYSVAHDLRAPLRSIDGFSQALLEDYSDKLDEEGKTHLRYVRESSQQMAKLIDDLLTLSRVSRTEVARTPIDLAATVRSVFLHLERDMPDRHVELNVPKELEAVGDGPLLRIVMENLVGNAWKFTGKCAHARIECGQQLQAGRSVYFVRDNGAGFDMAYAEKLFAVFQRLHSAREFEGTGIGLALVQRIISRHGGRVWAEGEVGRGATVYFTLEGDGQ